MSKMRLKQLLSDPSSVDFSTQGCSMPSPWPQLLLGGSLCSAS